MFPSLINTLSFWPWAVLALVPPAIVALYFLKLKRQPLEVPSTYLWQRSIEDLHVNSLWQRLRRSLLLLLQLLLIALLLIALLRPSWQGEVLTGDRFIFLVDNSASMKATDVEPSRLAAAKQRVGKLIDAMQSGDVAMLVSFSDTAEVVQAFTGNRDLLRNRLASITATDRRTSLEPALRVIASAAGRTGSTSGVAAEDVASTTGDPTPAPSDEEPASDDSPAGPAPASVYMVSDGRFPPVDDPALQAVEPILLPVGRADAGNVGILAFAVRRHELDVDRMQAIARLQNFGSAPAKIDLELMLSPADADLTANASASGSPPADAQLIDAARLTIPPGEQRGASFDLGGVDQGLLWLRASTGDRLPVDDVARLVVSEPRRGRVLLVTPGDESLALALSTRAARRKAELRVEPPSFLGSDEYQQAATGGTFDLVVFDRCTPKTMPQANTWILGADPPGDDWSLGQREDVPRVIDIDNAHPLLAWADVSDLLVITGRPIDPPPGADVLIDTDVGPMLAVAARGVFQDLVAGFAMVEQRAEGGGSSDGGDNTTSGDNSAGAGEASPVATYVTTNWPARPSFPVFVMNLLEYLGRGGGRGMDEVIRPGEVVSVDAPAGGAEVTVHPPEGSPYELLADSSGRVGITRTDELGIYRVSASGKTLRRFAVNLFDPAESAIGSGKSAGAASGDTATEAGDSPGDVALAGNARWQPGRRETWRWWLVGGLIILLAEWYIYNRRVYL